MQKKFTWLSAKREKMIQLKRCAIDGARQAINVRKEQISNTWTGINVTHSRVHYSFQRVSLLFLFGFVSFVSFICHMSAFAYMARCKMRCMQRSLPTIHVRATLIFCFHFQFFLSVVLLVAQKLFIYLYREINTSQASAKWAAATAVNAAHTLVPCGMCECVWVFGVYWSAFVNYWRPFYFQRNIFRSLQSILKFFFFSVVVVGHNSHTFIEIHRYLRALNIWHTASPHLFTRHTRRPIDVNTGICVKIETLFFSILFQFGCCRCCLPIFLRFRCSIGV